MSTVLETRIQTNKTSTFQESCDLFSKQCAVLFGFVVPVSTLATHVVLFFLMASWFLAGNLKEKVAYILNHPVARLTLVLFGIFVIGTLYSEASSANRLGMLQKMSKLLYVPLILPIMQEEKWRRAALFAFLSAMLLTLGLSLLKIYGGLSIFTNARLTITCVFKDSIFTNLMMAFASFMVGHLLLNQTNVLIRAVLGILLVGLVFYILFMSIGRSGYVVFVVLWLLWAVQRASFKGVVIGFLGLGILLSLAYFNSYPFKERLLLVKQDVVQYEIGNSRTSIGERLEFLNQTWQLSKQRLWFGHGTGSFKEVYQNHSAVHELIPTRNPHDEYINILFQLGFFGLTVFVGYFLFLFKWSFMLPRSEKWFAQGIILAMVTGCFANSWLMDFTSGYFFVMILAFCFGALNLKKGFSV